MDSKRLTLLSWVTDDPNLTEPDRTELIGAIATRGNRTGLVKRSQPRYGTAGYVGFKAIMLAIAPARASVWGLMLATENEKQTFSRLSDYAERNSIALTVFGSRPFEFNLWDYHNDRETAIELLTAYRSDGYKRGSGFIETRNAIAKRKSIAVPDNLQQTEPQPLADNETLALPFETNDR